VRLEDKGPDKESLRPHAQRHTLRNRARTMLSRRELPDARCMRPYCLVSAFTNPLPKGLTIPEPLRPYMQGRDFLPWVKELPKNLQKKAQ
jgi:hypothetical protein